MGTLVTADGGFDLQKKAMGGGGKNTGKRGSEGSGEGAAAPALPKTRCAPARAHQRSRGGVGLSVICRPCAVC